MKAEESAKRKDLARKKAEKRELEIKKLHQNFSKFYKYVPAVISILNLGKSMMGSRKVKLKTDYPSLFFVGNKSNVTYT